MKKAEIALRFGTSIWVPLDQFTQPGETKYMSVSEKFLGPPCSSTICKGTVFTKISTIMEKMLAHLSHSDFGEK